MHQKTEAKVVFAAACAMFLVSQSVFAVEDSDFRFDSTSDLLDVCSVSEGASEFAIANQACRAFIEASVQYHDQVTDRKRLKRLICYPKTATIEEGKRAFVAWAQSHAKDKKLMAEQPVVGLVRSLAAKYPCGD